MFFIIFKLAPISYCSMSVLMSWYKWIVLSVFFNFLNLMYLSFCEQRGEV